MSSAQAEIDELDLVDRKEIIHIREESPEIPERPQICARRSIVPPRRSFTDEVELQSLIDGVHNTRFKARKLAQITSVLEKQATPPARLSADQRSSDLSNEFSVKTPSPSDAGGRLWKEVEKLLPGGNGSSRRPYKRKTKRSPTAGMEAASSASEAEREQSINTAPKKRKIAPKETLYKMTAPKDPEPDHSATLHSRLSTRSSGQSRTVGGLSKKPRPATAATNKPKMQSIISGRPITRQTTRASEATEKLPVRSSSVPKTIESAVGLVAHAETEGGNAIPGDEGGQNYTANGWPRRRVGRPRKARPDLITFTSPEFKKTKTAQRPESASPSTDSAASDSLSPSDRSTSQNSQLEQQQPSLGAEIPNENRQLDSAANPPVVSEAPPVIPVVSNVVSQPNPIGEFTSPYYAYTKDGNLIPLIMSSSTSSPSSRPQILFMQRTGSQQTFAFAPNGVPAPGTRMISAPMLRPPMPRPNIMRPRHPVKVSLPLSPPRIVTPMRPERPSLLTASQSQPQLPSTSGSMNSSSDSIAVQDLGGATGQPSRRILSFIREPVLSVKVSSDPKARPSIIGGEQHSIPPLLLLSGFVPKKGEAAFLLVFAGTSAKNPCRNFFYELTSGDGPKNWRMKTLSGGTQALERDVPMMKDPVIPLDNVGIISRNAFDAPLTVENDHKVKLICRLVLKGATASTTMQVISREINCEVVDTPRVTSPKPPVPVLPRGPPLIRTVCPAVFPANGNIDVAILGRNFSMDSKVVLRYVAKDSEIEIEEELPVNEEYRTSVHLVSKIPPSHGSAVMTAQLLVRDGDQESEPFTVRCFSSYDGRKASSNDVSIKLPIPRDEDDVRNMVKVSADRTHHYDAGCAQVYEAFAVFRINNIRESTPLDHVLAVLQEHGGVKPAQVQVFHRSGQQRTKVVVFVLRSVDRAAFSAIDPAMWNLQDESL